MLDPIDPASFERIFATSRGLIELGLVALCIGFAWFIDWRLRVRAHAAEHETRSEIASGLSRAAFPLLALVFLFCLRFALRKMGFIPFLVDLAVPLLIALTLIRLLVYGMRRLFSRQSWLKGSERAIALCA